MDKELAPANQRIANISFKDLTGRVAAIREPKPAKTPAILAKENKPKAADTEVPAKPKTS